MEYSNTNQRDSEGNNYSSKLRSISIGLTGLAAIALNGCAIEGRKITLEIPQYDKQAARTAFQDVGKGIKGMVQGAYNTVTETLGGKLSANRLIVPGSDLERVRGRVYSLGKDEKGDDVYAIIPVGVRPSDNMGVWLADEIPRDYANVGQATQFSSSKGTVFAYLIGDGTCGARNVSLEKDKEEEDLLVTCFPYDARTRVEEIAGSDEAPGKPGVTPPTPPEPPVTPPVPGEVEHVIPGGGNDDGVRER